MILITLFLSLFTLQAKYLTNNNTSCDGYPQINISSLADTCVGLVVDQNLKDINGESIRFPRKILEWKENQFLVVDMGGWTPYLGKIWLLDTSGNKPRLKALLNNLASPHGIEIGPDGQIYIGELGSIFRFQPEANDPKSTCEIVVANLPSSLPAFHGNPCTEKRKVAASNAVAFRHPLIAFTFSKDTGTRWDLIVNGGSASDDCKNQFESNGRCKESDGKSLLGTVKRYAYQGNYTWAQNPNILARGLRNSMVLVSHESGLLLQMENSMDLKSPEEPYEEINIIGNTEKHYGWPYCYNFRASSAQNSYFLCNEQNTNYQMPYALLPPHVAPLDAIYYNSDLIPELKNHLLVSWHGYREAGQKIVAIEVDSDGVPVLSKQTFSYSWFDESKNASTKKLAVPIGGNSQHVAFLEVLFNWDKSKLPFLGAPVGLTVASDGSIFVVEDKNKTILRISRGKAITASTTPEAPKTLRPETLNNQSLMHRWSLIFSQTIKPNCSSCHSPFGGSDAKAVLQGLVRAGQIIPGKPEESPFYLRLLGEELAQMPPMKKLDSRNIEEIRRLIMEL